MSDVEECELRASILLYPEDGARSAERIEQVVTNDSFIHIVALEE